jgi:Helix-turn-helix domain
MILTYKYKLLPIKEQHGKLKTMLNITRSLYNVALKERISAYKNAAIVGQEGCMFNKSETPDKKALSPDTKYVSEEDAVFYKRIIAKANAADQTDFSNQPSLGQLSRKDRREKLFGV